MNIVVLDGYTTNPGDLNWDWLYPLGNVTIYDRTPPDLTVERARDADILINNKTPLTKAVLKQLPKLKYVALLSTGSNIIDAAAAKEQGIPVSNIPEYSTGAVAQMVFAYILYFYNHVAFHSDAVHQGEWERSTDFCFWKKPLIELEQKTLGVIGYGKIGRRVAQLARAFEMDVCAYSRSRKTGETDENGVRFLSMDELLCTADIASLHCPLTKETQHMMNEEAFAKMKPSSLFINTSRGPLVDEAALAQVLNQEKISGACLDVLSTEPPSRDNPLLSAKNCIITPHIAWAGQETRNRLLNIARQNVESFLAGNPQNLISL